MPELPEITSRAREMQAALTGKTIGAMQILQPKCLNINMDAFQTALNGAKIEAVNNHGKWIFTRTSQGWLLLNLGMGGEILLTNRASLPKKHRLVFDFADETCLAVNFWWFGYAHYVGLDQLSSHEMTAKLGPNAMDISVEELKDLVHGSRSRLKAFLLDQSRLAGIGNAYIHDILFLARLHPLRTLDSLSEDDIVQLFDGIHKGLQPAMDKHGAFYEVDLFGKAGGFSADDILVGYRENQPCPRCGTLIQKIKTGGTSSFICPSCQPL